MNQLTFYGLLGLAVLVGINAVVYGGPWLVGRLKARKSSRTASNDAAPPSGAVEWVQQITAAAGGSAEPDFILNHLLIGSTAAGIMASRIKQLETPASPPVKP